MTVRVTWPVASIAHTIPEAEEVVEARRRQWIVSEVDRDAVAPGLPKRHFVRLASIDEDAIGDEIEVPWELGAHVIKRAGLPRMTGLDEPQTFLDAVRWGAATDADRPHLQSHFRRESNKDESAAVAVPAKKAHAWRSRR